DGSSRLRRQKTLTLSGGGFCLFGNRRVRIWEEFARIARTTVPLVSAEEKTSRDIRLVFFLLGKQ
ncbi:MAG: hypothetical protein EBU96_07725, partial [Actinobacteria bacterium]|nr:hypothetical protein [Actinomycetota bacterium]